MPAAQQARAGAYPSLSKNPYRLRVDSLTGTNFIIGNELFLTSSNGIKPIFMQRDGLSLGEFLSVPDRILGPVMSNLQPDLIIWHMKELTDLGQGVTILSNQLEALETHLKTSAPNADVIYIGTPYAYSNDQGSTLTLEQNQLVRRLALRHGRAYVDGMTGMLSYTNMLNNGYLDDDVHPSNQYYQWLSSTLWEQTLFSLLRKNRRMTIRPIGSGVEISGPRFTSAQHQLLGSSNMTDWQILQTAGPGSQSWLVTNPPAPFLRLRYLPP